MRWAAVGCCQCFHGLRRVDAESIGRFSGHDTMIGSTGMDSRQWRLLVGMISAGVCIMGATDSGTRPALAQSAGNVGARCSVNSDCRSGVCHPATRLCMISAAAVQSAGESKGANPGSGPTVCIGNQCMPKASGTGVGARCTINSDCGSGVCHPATHLCMLSAAAAAHPLNATTLSTSTLSARATPN